MLIFIALIFVLLLIVTYAKPQVVGSAEPSRDVLPSQVDVGRALVNFVPIGQSVNIPTEYQRTAAELGYPVSDQGVKIIIGQSPLQPNDNIHIGRMDNPTYSLGFTNITTTRPILESQTVKCGYVNQRTEYNKAMRLIAVKIN